MHQYLNLGNGIVIPMYNLMIGIGAIIGFLILENEIKKSKIKFKTDKHIYYSIIVSSLCGLFGAKFFEIVYKQSYINFQIFYSSGLTFYGGLIFGFCSFYLINKFFKTNNMVAFNLIIPSLIVTHGFGRIGCFFAGCCYGKQTDSILGVCFPKGSIPAQHLGELTYLHPVQLYESCFLFLLFFLIFKFISFEYRIVVYFIAYSIFRFVIEFLRADYRGIFLTKYFSPSQIISIFILILGLIIMSNIRLGRISKNNVESIG